jgi:thiamine-phosphate pyrophosphorylase
LNYNFPRIYAITDTRISGISHKKQIEQMIEGGIELIQLRDKYASPREFYESAKVSISIARQHKVKIIINDRIDIALVAGADGVHLGQNDLPPKFARKILGPKAIIGFSSHSLEQARAAMGLPVDYIAIGPIFSTATKENPDAVVGLGVIRALKHEIAYKALVAIGGINLWNVADIIAAGADSAAVIGALLSDAHRIRENAEMLISQAHMVN